MKTLSLRSALLINLAPLAVFSVLILIVTGLVITTVDAEVSRLTRSLATGALGPEDIADEGHRLLMVWMGSLVGFFMFSGGTAALSLWLYRMVDGRVHDLVALAGRSAAGVVEGDRPIADSCPLGAVEVCIYDIGVSIRDQATEVGGTARAQPRRGRREPSASARVGGPAGASLSVAEGADQPIPHRAHVPQDLAQLRPPIALSGEHQPRVEGEAPLDGRQQAGV